MTRLSISLLGVPQIILDGTPVKVLTQRAIPLLAYLALTGSSQPRETLASLLWSDVSQKRAFGSLRTTLWRLKSSGLDDWITVTPDEISLNHHNNIDIDVREFRHKLNQCSTHGHPASQICLYCLQPLTEAIELYRGEFMTGFNLSKARAFDSWRMQESEALYILYLDALERLVRGHRTFGDFNLAIHYARKWLSQDHYNESAQHDLLQLYILTGQRAAAISLYKHYRDLLLHELGIEPSEEIAGLYKQILSGKTNLPVKEPVKTPVFLLANIDNLGMYLAQIGDRKDTVLSTYQNIVLETSKRFGGHAIQKSDESTTILFEQGLPGHCAVTIHLRIKQTDWGNVSPPPVRMVLFSTAADHGKTGNFATLTSAAASLLAISWGGQIVFTEQTLRYLDQPSGSRIKDLGFHTLKEVDASVHVYELLHPHLPSVDHLPLRSGSRQMVNFPPLTPAFLGREDELTQLSTIMDSTQNRIVSLVGPGGVGKTHLAVQFATNYAQHFPDGVFYIPLAPIQDADHIPIALADTLKFSFYGTKNYPDQLADYLHRRKALLVFDNFEHLLPAGGKFLAFLLSQTHHLKILVTTRERLTLISESVMEVQGFPVPPVETTENLEGFSSIKLFLNNAQRIFPRFNLSGNLPDIVRICQLVDGLPLGIMLASSWVRVYNCSEIAEKIKKNIDFLATSAPDVAPRHRSLRAVFDSSWKLLSEVEQQALSRLSIFPATFTTQAAEEICSTTPLALAAFIDKSLLSRRPNRRYEMLETFRQFAHDKLEAAEPDFIATRTKFCEYYTRFCVQKHQEINTSAQLQALSEVVPAIENIRTAWIWMIESNRWDLVKEVISPLLTYMVLLGNFVQGREFFHIGLLKLNEIHDPSLELIRTSVRQSEAWMLVKTGFITEGLHGLSECLEIFRSENSHWDVALTLMYIAEGSRALGNFQLARGYIEEALQEIHNPAVPNSNYARAVAAHCQSILGVILLRLMDYEQAEQQLKASLATHRAIGTRYGTIHPLMGLGSLAFYQADFFKAKDLYLQALETANHLYDQLSMARLHNNLADVSENLVDIGGSYHHILSALKICRDTGDRRLMAIILNNLAYHQLRYLHQPAESIRTYHEAMEIFSTLGDLRGVAYSCYDLSRAYLQAGLLEEAWEYCSRSMQTAITMDSIPLIIHSLHGYAYLFAKTGRLEQAMRLCCMIISHPQVGPDTQKRAIVTRVEVELKLAPENIQAAEIWGKSANLQDVIDQILVEKFIGRG